MDGFSSDFSHGYGGTQVGQGYTGSVSLSGNTDIAGTQGVDTTQLQQGDTFQGEIVSVNGEDVQILLSNGQYMAAKLERDVQVALGQILNLQVQSNKNNRIVLKPVNDGNSMMLRVGEAALKAANMAVNEKNLTLVSKLIENGMSINKNSLMTFNRLALQNSQVSMEDIIKLNKLQMPVNEKNVLQFQNYQNMEHKLIDGIKEASDEVIKLYDTLSQNQEVHAEIPVKFMEQVLKLISGDDIITNEKPMMNTVNQDGAVNNNPNTGNATDTVDIANPENTEILKTISDNEAGEQVYQQPVKAFSDEKAFISAEQLKNETPQTFPDKIIRLIKNDKINIQDLNELLKDTDISKMMTSEQKAKIFHSEPFKSMIKNEMQKQWTLTPKELSQEGKVEEFYQKLMNESRQLSKLMNETMQSSGQAVNNTPARAATGLSENLEFMNQMNQILTYVQLPLRLNNSQAHGDLYVYTNKKNMAHRDGMLTAFLHLDMDNLGALDVSIALQTEKNQVTTKFYLDEEVLSLVEEHIGELTQRLAKKGYQCKNMVLEKEEDKTVLERMEEQISGGNSVLSYQTFDTRA